MRRYLDLDKEEEEHALALHREAIIVDGSIVPFIHSFLEGNLRFLDIAW